MAHVIEPAASGRSKCRGCKQSIGKGEYRFGECLPNPFADGDMTLWFHIDCSALRRPDAFLEVIKEHADKIENLERLRAAAEEGVAHHRLQRLCRVEKAPSGRASCRACREAIARDEWRIGLEFFEEGAFNPSGYVHLGCSGEYFGTTAILPRVRRFSPGLTAQELKDIETLLK